MKDLLLLLFIFSCISFHFLLTISAASARDTITPTQPFSENQSLVSSGRRFALGFFSFDGSKNRYLGIWFNNIPTQTVVWVANRDHPLTDSSGVLKINNNGSLALVNQSESILWSTSIPSSVDNPIAQLLDNGNLVIKHESNNDPRSYIWQSFDHPCDTLLEGAKLGWNLKTGLNRQLVSWKNFEDPSPGNFTYGLDPRGFPEMVLHNRLVEKFRSGPWNGIQFSGAPKLMSNPVFEPSFVSNEEELYFTFERNEGSVIIRFVLDPLGLLHRYTWNNRSQQWVLTVTALIDQCDNYGLCGAYGVCDMNDAVNCKCLKGFVPKSQQDWDRLDWSSGCRRRTTLNCQKGDGFVKLESVKLPSTTFAWVNSMSLRECKMECLKNCSCTAYANSDIRGAGSGCVLWFGDLLDIRRYTEGGQDLYLRLAGSELEVKKKKWVIVSVAISVVLAMLLLGTVIWCIIRRKQRGTKDIEDKENANENQRSELELPLFDFVTLETATSNFSVHNKLGEGGFGPVYKGELSMGQEIAVKRLSNNSGQGIDEFKNEVILIAKLQHCNLVRLLGCCIQRNEKMLIYEYMSNKSLDFFIFDQARSRLLTWQKRFNIIVGIAQGLLYLHSYSRLRIIHRDLKASNILLDSHMNPKISDFGLARIFGDDQMQAKTGKVVGTYGYMSPEYVIDGLFSMKSDVFSFGVLVLEIASGMKNRGFDHPDHGLNLLGHAWNLWNEGKASKLVDTVMEEVLTAPEVLRCIQVGLLCVQQRPEDRPTMAVVVLMLGSVNAITQQPKQPGFYYERCLVEEGQSSIEKMFYYANQASITLTEGR